MPPSPPQNALDILAFHREAGVDIALEDAPVDRFAESVSEGEQTRDRGSRETLVRNPEPPALQNRNGGDASRAPGFGFRDEGPKNSAAPVPPDAAALAALTSTAVCG